MILVDSRVGSKELLLPIQKLGVQAELSQLEAGDFCFYGNTGRGQTLVGIERKRLDSSDDLLASIHTGRYAGEQQHKMVAMYGVRILLVEGIWKPNSEGNLLVMDWKGWREIIVKGKPLPFRDVFRWLTSVTFCGGTHWMQSGSPYETAVRVVETYHWFSKPWEDHQSQNAMHQLSFPQFSAPSFEQRVAAQIGGLGVKKSLAAVKYFGNVPTMVEASEADWMKIDGIGKTLARRIVDEIRGGQILL